MLSLFSIEASGWRTQYQDTALIQAWAREDNLFEAWQNRPQVIRNPKANSLKRWNFQTRHVVQ